MNKIDFSSEYGNMDKIICLVGCSGSGKTTLAKELEGKGYNIIHSYTTRQPRYENEWGHTFIDTTNFNEGCGILEIGFNQYNSSDIIYLGLLLTS